MQSPNDTPALRLAVFGIVVVSLFATLLARLTYLQVMDTQKFATQAAANQVRIVYEPAPRGRILDRQGRVLVDNRASLAVTISRADAADHPQVLTKLAALLGKPKADLEKRINDGRYSPYKPIPLAEDVDEGVIVHIRERQDQYPGVSAVTVAQRAYPHGTLAAHLVGYVGEVNEKELVSEAANEYRLGDDIGKSGVEKVYEPDLRGKAGVTKLEVNANGRVLRILDTQAPVAGHDVQLSIDLDVQRVAEESLRLGLIAARTQREEQTGKRFAAPAGSVVVTDPTDGSILAMASNPTYDPAQFIGGIRTDVFAALQDPKNHYPLNNRAVAGLYAPGSTFKLVTAVAAWKVGLIDARTTVMDRGTLEVGNRTFKNAGSRAHGSVNTARALTVSSDVFFYKLGAQIWEGRSKYGNAIQTTAREFGLGQKTGIPFGAETAGRVPDPEIRKQMHDENPDAFPESRWFTGDNVNLAIGQGELVVTPLQLASTYATFANGGTRWQPKVASRVLDGSKVVREISPIQVGTVEIPAAATSSITQGLAGAVANGEGTAYGAFAGFPLDDFPIAGKTGTAQVTNKQDSALFVGWGPVSAPQYTVAVVMEEAGFGGVAAAPVARRVFDQLAGAPLQDVTLGEVKD